MILAVNFHYIRDSFEAPFPAIFGKTPHQFGIQLEELSKIGEFISSDQLNDAIRKGTKLPEKSLFLTFDDGLKEQLQYAVPILNRMGIPACFYVNTKVLEDYSLLNVHLIHLVRSLISPKLILEQVLEEETYKKIEEAQKSRHREMGIAHYRYDEPENAFLKYILNFVLDRQTVLKIFRKLFNEVLALDMSKVHQDLYLSASDLKTLATTQSIGSHSHDHLPIGTLDLKEAQSEVIKSTTILSDMNIKAHGFSYPYGSKEAVGDSASWLGDFGFSYAVTMDRGINTDLNQPFTLKRCDNNDVPGGKSYSPELIKPFLI